MKTYTLTVKRAAVNASSDAKLSALEISAGTVSPAFDKDVKSYTALVATNQGMPSPGTPFTVTPTITVNAGSTFVITSGRNNTRLTGPGADIGNMPLSVGANVITIKVTAENLVATETYTLTGDARRCERFG